MTDGSPVNSKIKLAISQPREPTKTRSDVDVAKAAVIAELVITAVVAAIASCTYGSAELAHLDVIELDRSVWVLASDVLGCPCGRRAWAAQYTRLALGFVHRIFGVEPEHVGKRVVPQRE